MSHTQGPRIQLEANARLIAAAPEMFGALTDAVKVMESCLHNHCGHMSGGKIKATAVFIHQAKTVLAKAKGEA